MLIVFLKALYYMVVHFNIYFVQCPICAYDEIYSDSPSRHLGWCRPEFLMHVRFFPPSFSSFSIVLLIFFPPKWQLCCCKNEFLDLIPFKSSFFFFFLGVCFCFFLFFLGWGVWSQVMFICWHSLPYQEMNYLRKLYFTGSVLFTLWYSGDHCRLGS